MCDDDESGNQKNPFEGLLVIVVIAITSWQRFVRLAKALSTRSFNLLVDVFDVLDVKERVSQSSSEKEVELQSSLILADLVKSRNLLQLMRARYAILESISLERYHQRVQRMIMKGLSTCIFCCFVVCVGLISNS